MSAKDSRYLNPTEDLLYNSILSLGTLSKDFYWYSIRGGVLWQMLRF